MLGLLAAVPRLDGIVVNLLGVVPAIEQFAEFARLSGAHPDRVPKHRFVAQAHERALDLEIPRDVRVTHRQTGGKEADTLVDGLRNAPRIRFRTVQGAEGIVSREQFVTAVAAERDRDVLPGEAGEKIGGEERTIPQRFIEPRNAPGEKREGFVEIEDVPPDAACPIAPQRAARRCFHRSSVH